MVIFYFLYSQFWPNLIFLIFKDEFRSYAAEKPEYAQIFLIYHEIKILNSNLEIDRLVPRDASPELKSTLPSLIKRTTKSTEEKSNDVEFVPMDKEVVTIQKNDQSITKVE